MRERTLRPATVEVAPRRIANPTSWVYRLALFGVVLTILLPSSMLLAFGVLQRQARWQSADQVPPSDLRIDRRRMARTLRPARQWSDSTVP